MRSGVFFRHRAHRLIDPVLSRVREAAACLATINSRRPIDRVFQMTHDFGVGSARLSDFVTARMP